MLSLSPNLRKLLGAQIPADFADWLDFVAIAAMLAYVWNAPPVGFALLAFAMGAPTLIIGPIVAGHVDQADLRSVMIWANLGRAVATICLALAPSWPVLLGFVALRSAVDSAYTPAKQAAIQACANDAELTKANQLSQAINQLSKILAPAAGGALLIVIEPSDVFLVNALFSLIAALLLTWFPANLRAPAEKQGLLDGLRDAARIIRSNAVLSFAIAAMAMVLGATFLFDSLIAPHLKSMGYARNTVGFTISAVGIGTVLGALLPMRDTPSHMRWELCGSAVIAAALLSFLGWAETALFPVPMWGLITVFFVFGILSARVFIPLRVLMQRETPPEHMARVASLSESLNMIALLIPPFIGAAIAEASSTGWAFITAALVYVLLAPVFWRMCQR